MQKEALESFQKMTQLTLENFKKLGETNLRIGEKLLQQQVALTSDLLEIAARNVGTAETKDYKEIAEQQAEWAQQSAQKVVDSCTACGNILAEAGKVYSTLFDASVKAAKDTAEKQAGKARK
jgi:hypothetical protein